MSDSIQSKKSSAKRFVKRVVPEKTLWADWKAKEIHDIEYEGVKFQAGIGYSDQLFIGPKLRMQAFECEGADIVLYRNPENNLGDANSCAYKKANPYGQTDNKLAMWRWVLFNSRIPKGTLAYLTQNDAGANQYRADKEWEGRLQKMHDSLKLRGYKLVCENKSIHTGNYPVWLYIHPGDDKLVAERAARRNKNKNKVTDANVLGSADAGVPSPGNSGDTPAGERTDRLIPITPAIAA